MSFRGIATAALDFYEDLEVDNSKSFWTAHKAVYDEVVRAPIAALAEELAPEFGPGKIFRPYRDVRFSADKTPYKTHQGVWFDQAKTYLHISAAGLFVAAGYWRTSPAQVARMRRAIDTELPGEALVAAITAVTKRGAEVGGEQLTRVPKGFDKEHPRADLLRHKTLTVHRDVGCPAWLSTARAKNEIAKIWRGFAPLTTWLNTHVGPD